MYILLSLLMLALMVGAIIDIMRRDDSEVKFLPKIAWVLIAVLIPLGGLLWFLLGREYNGSGVSLPRMPRRERAPRKPQTPSAPARPTDTRSTEQQIADLDREIEEWRLRAEIEKRRREDGESDPA